MRRRIALSLGFLLGAGTILAACMMPYGWGGGPLGLGRSFRSNGEQIYFTATSQRGTPITADMGMGMMGGMMPCAACHGPDGRGRTVWMMMNRFTAPDIRYRTLTAEGMAHEGEGHETEHPPYTEETLRRAITRGLNPAGEPLAWPMPRWQMSDEDLNDLIDFLKTLE